MCSWAFDDPGLPSQSATHLVAGNRSVLLTAWRPGLRCQGVGRAMLLCSWYGGPFLAPSSSWRMHTVFGVLGLQLHPSSLLALARGLRASWGTCPQATGPRCEGPHTPCGLTLTTSICPPKRSHLQGPEVGASLCLLGDMIQPVTALECEHFCYKVKGTHLCIFLYIFILLFDIHQQISTH